MATTAEKPVPAPKPKAKAKTKLTDAQEIAKAKIAEAQEKAKAVYAKGAEAFGDVKGFTKDNLDAVVESGKVFGGGLKALGNDYVAGGKGAFAMVEADIKGLADIKSPADFVKYQSGILGRNIELSMAFGTKHVDTVYKLAKDTAAPLSRRMSEVAKSLKTA
ncbi:MAG: phasin family protein [Novosphingobium sp.]|nr:phasin family protein [Novosphingobium sp.]